MRVSVAEALLVVLVDSVGIAAQYVRVDFPIGLVIRFGGRKSVGVFYAATGRIYQLAIGRHAGSIGHSYGSLHIGHPNGDRGIGIGEFAGVRIHRTFGGCIGDGETRQALAASAQVGPGAAGLRWRVGFEFDRVLTRTLTIQGPEEVGALGSLLLA